MKKNLMRVCVSMLAILMCAASFASCGSSEEPADTTTAATTTAATTEATTQATTEATTTTAATTTKKETTTTTTEPPAPPVEEVKDGLIVFYEDFNSYANTDKTEDALKAIKWTKLTKEKDGVYSESDAEFAIVDGRLYYDNYDAEALPEGDTRVRGKDSYYRIDMLVDDYMKPISMGKYTLQYDLEYTDSKSISRYAVVITECSADGQCYNSFHFRIGGYGNNQCHFYGSWKTYDAFDPATDLYVASTATDAETAATKGTPISFKLLGKYYNKEDVHMFANIPVTIRQQWDPEMGHSCFMKTAEMKDFVQVSEPSVNADGPMYIGWDGWAVQFKIGATIDGYIDNIVIWTGHGAQPSGKTVTYKPAA
ncbi:MAG: hypothetical protein IJW99_04730 [Clostridia bacterium]|nr:hypothetical protein [Clostridia bacterium]